MSDISDISLSDDNNELPELGPTLRERMTVDSATDVKNLAKGYTGKKSIQ